MIHAVRGGVSAVAEGRYAMNTLQPLPLSPTDVAAQERAIPVDLEVACLWSTLGLILTALFLALGFGIDIGQAVMLAG